MVTTSSSRTSSGRWAAPARRIRPASTPSAFASAPAQRAWTTSNSSSTLRLVRSRPGSAMKGTARPRSSSRSRFRRGRAAGCRSVGDGGRIGSFSESLAQGQGANLNAAEDVDDPDVTIRGGRPWSLAFAERTSSRRAAGGGFIGPYPWSSVRVRRARRRPADRRPEARLLDRRSRARHDERRPRRGLPRRSRRHPRRGQVRAGLRRRQGRPHRSAAWLRGRAHERTVARLTGRRAK